MTIVTELLKRRMAAIGYDYPPVYLGAAWLAIVAGAIGAAAQRYPFSSTVGLVCALSGCVIALCPPLRNVVSGSTSKVKLSIAELVAVNLLLVEPVDSTDITLLLIIVPTVTMVASTSSKHGSLALAGAAGATFIIAGARHAIDNPALYVATVAFAWVIGYLLVLQTQLHRQVQLAQSIRTVQATSDERQRIAREVHDVIAHSLTITLLNVTGARRALQEDRDIDEAIDALTDAERMGRHAMSDIRRTVHILGDGHGGTEPEPNVSDISALVQDYRRAGMCVSFDTSGCVEKVSAATGLALYRITQESLANAVKHALGSRVDVTLTVDDGSTVEIRNDASGTQMSTIAMDGSGISGMRTRARLLGGNLEAGPESGGWRVRAVFPDLQVRNS